MGLAQSTPRPPPLSREVRDAVLLRFAALRVSLLLTETELVRLYSVFCEWNVAESGELVEARRKSSGRGVDSTCPSGRTGGCAGTKGLDGRAAASLDLT